MYLQKLVLYNFKNYEEADLQLSDKINCFVGDNGAGKTNLLDAIHYLSLCKSYFTQVDTQNIRHGEEFFAIHGTCDRGDPSPETLQCIQKRGQRKRFLVNKKEYDRLADHIGNFPLVMISPYDRDLINDGSEFRRKYMDSVISQFDRLYLDDLINYNKALAHRNALLKSFAERQSFDAGSLEIWDEQLVRLGEGIYTKRTDFLERFIPVFQEYYRLLSRDAEQVGIIYQSQLSDGSYKDLMASCVHKDRSAQ